MQFSPDFDPALGTYPVDDEVQAKVMKHLAGLFQVDVEVSGKGQWHPVGSFTLDTTSPQSVPSDSPELVCQAISALAFAHNEELNQPANYRARLYCMSSRNGQGPVRHFAHFKIVPITAGDESMDSISAPPDSVTLLMGAIKEVLDASGRQRVQDHSMISQLMQQLSLSYARQNQLMQTMVANQDSLARASQQGWAAFSQGMQMLVAGSSIQAQYERQRTKDAVESARTEAQRASRSSTFRDLAPFGLIAVTHLAQKQGMTDVANWLISVAAKMAVENSERVTQEDAEEEDVIDVSARPAPKRAPEPEAEREQVPPAATSSAGAAPSSDVDVQRELPLAVVAPSRLPPWHTERDPGKHPGVELRADAQKAPLSMACRAFGFSITASQWVQLQQIMEPRQLAVMLDIFTAPDEMQAQSRLMAVMQVPKSARDRMQQVLRPDQARVVETVTQVALGRIGMAPRVPMPMLALTELSPEVATPNVADLSQSDREDGPADDGGGRRKRKK